MIRRIVPIALLLLAGVVSAAGLERYKAWDKSPEFRFLATDAEQKAWKKVASDEEAARFIDLFWAKRDPDLKTPVNEYKVVFDERVKDADRLFAMPHLRGALTERGKAFILIGPPKSPISRVNGTKPQPGLRAMGGEATAPGSTLPLPNDPGTSIGEWIETWTWEAANLPDWTKMKSLIAKFVVEESSDFVGGNSAGDVTRLEASARTALLKSPDLKEAPHYRTAAELEADRQAALAAEAEARKGPALTPAIRASLEGLAADTALLSVLPLAGGEADDTRIQAQIFLPASAGEPPADSRLAFLVRDKDGKDAGRYEEATPLEPAAGGRFASRWFSVPPGDYTVTAGVFNPGGRLIGGAKKPVTVAPPPVDFAISPIVIAAAFFPVASPRPQDAFTFSGQRFLAKGGRLDPEDGLSFVFRAYNPAVDPATKTVSLSRTVKLKAKGSPAMDVPQPQDPPLPAPDRKDKGSGILTVDVSAVLIDSRLGEYLRKPGEYEIRVFVTDNVSKKTAEGVASFVVTGTLPPKKK
ncbi:MAG TPA: GWxTD domain-containing protein [Thermoanaerobaculia bacterium]|nr:GWxTD domain-containing protein [Thermoanaerobaculia bacterium]